MGERKEPIVHKYVKLHKHNRFQIEVSTNLQEIGMQGYERYSNMSDSIHKIEPVMLHEELNNFKAGIITDVTPLQYDIRKDRWTYTIYGYGVYNKRMTTKEIVRNYYIKGDIEYV